MVLNYWHQSKVRKDVGDNHYRTHLFLSLWGKKICVCATTQTLYLLLNFLRSNIHKCLINKNISFDTTRRFVHDYYCFK